MASSIIRQPRGEPSGLAKPGRGPGGIEPHEAVRRILRLVLGSGKAKA